MFPWHTNRIFVIGYTLHAGGVFFSIAHFIRKVEDDFQMSMIHDSLLEFQLRPAELPSRFDIPCPLLGSQFRLQDDHILSPADGHGLSQHFRCALIGTIELPHPAQVPGGEARGVRVCAAQILRRGNSGAFLWPVADQPANLTVQFHLGQVCRHQRIQRREHGAVVNRFSDVHSGFSFPAQVRLFLFSTFEIANEQAHGHPRACSLAVSGRVVVTPIAAPPSVPTG